MQKIDLKNTPIPKLFFSYFIPSLITMLALSTYSTIDGIFVGRKLGDDALAAIGIAWPIFPLIIGFELLLSFGGGTLVSYYIGKGKPYKARAIFSSAFYFAFVVSLSCGLLCFVFTGEIARALGASARLESLVVDYLRVVFLGMVFIALHPLSDVFAINDKKPMLATFSMIISAISNVFLNYLFLFVLDWGISGSALATILAHMIGLLVLLQHFLRGRGDLFFIRAFSLRGIFIAARAGLPQCSAELSAAVVMFLFNTTLMRIAGERGVAIYSILMYSGIVFFTLLISVAQGMQPIVSFSHGAGLFGRVREVFGFSFVVACVVGVLLYTLAYLWGENLVWLFLGEGHAGDEAFVAEVVHAMRIYYFGYIFLGINILTAVFLQSLQRTRASFILTLFYTLGFVAVLLPLFSHYFGQNGAWFSYPSAQFLSLFVVVAVLLVERKHFCEVKNDK